LNLSDTVRLALKLPPEVQQAVVVTGADDADKAYVTRGRAQFRQFESRLQFTYLSGLPRNELERRLASLPPRSFVYYLLVSRDGTGQNVHPLDYVDRVSAVANAPVYCWVDSALDHGVIGGVLKNQEAEIDTVGRLALRILGGESADGIAVTSPNLNVPEVNWRQLQRWHISESMVPAGTVIRLRQLSAWATYRLYILGALALILGETALITALLIQLGRRRRAEAQAQRHQARLRTSYDRIRDLGARLLSAQDAERARIARDLHDDISQQVAVLAFDLQRLMDEAGKNGNKTIDSLARTATDKVEMIAKGLHDVSHALHPAQLRVMGLMASIDSLRRQLSTRDLPIAFSHDAVPADIPHDTRLCLFRVAQEALQNAVKHSGASRIAMALRATESDLTLTVVDDGKGFDVGSSWGAGLGLISMSERAESLGGTLRIHSQPGGGTHVTVIVPLRVPSMAAVEIKK
jgi:signal transduction histidine kinase